MKILRLLLRSSGKNLVIAAIASFISGGSSAGIIATINYAISSLPDLPSWLVWLFIGLSLSLWLFKFTSWVLVTRLSQDIVYNLRLDLTQRILNSPLQSLEVIGASKLMANLTGDISAIASASIQIAIVIVNLAVLIGIFTYLFWLSPLLFLTAFLSIAGGFSLYSFLQKLGIKEFVKGRQVQDKLFGHFRAVTEGTKELKLHRDRRIAFMSEELKPSAAQAKYYRVKATTSFAFAGSLGSVLFFVPVGLILFVLPELDLVDTALISSYTLAVLYIIEPVGGIASALPEIARANVSLDKIEALGLSLNKLTTEPDLNSKSKLNSNWKSWELVNLHHAYQGNSEEHKFALDNINLQFQPGEVTFIVGGNGSGKSTLVKLIAGLYIPDLGQVVFDGIPITDENREWYRQQFSAVFYDFYLFDRLMGIDASKEVEIQRYLTLLEIDHKVTIKDGLLSTTNLSQGQRKRLALLTAYLENRPIYIFDEWASDQDPVFKQVFYEKLLPELKNRGKTVIAVTHDDKYFDCCDRLIKLDYGRVASAIANNLII